MRRVFSVLLGLLVIGMTGCTENQRAKSFGGTTSISLARGQKLVNVTWKESNLWYLTRKMRAGEEPETYEFKEKSDFGVYEGTVIFKESE